MILKELHYRNNIINLMKRNVKLSINFSKNWQRILLRTQVQVKHVTSIKIKLKSDINEYIFFIIKSTQMSIVIHGENISTDGTSQYVFKPTSK